jgi:hypothetical protein
LAISAASTTGLEGEEGISDMIDYHTTGLQLELLLAIESH